MSAGQPHRAALIVATGGKALGENQAAVDMKAVADEGWPRLVGQLGAIEIQLSDDVGARQPDRAELAVSGGDETPAENVAVDVQPVADEGRAGLVSQARTVEVELAFDVGAE